MSVAPQEPRTKRAPGWLPWIASAMVAAPIILAPYPPMTDLAAHETIVALLRARSDPSKFPPGFLILNLGHPNQLFHLLAWPLTFIVTATLAAKVVAGLAAGSIPWGVGRLARYLGASPALSLLAVPVALGWIFNWGFVNNLLGVGLLLALLPPLDRFVRNPSRGGMALMIGATFVLYEAHELMLFVFIGACGIFTLVSPYSLRRWVVRLTPAALGLIVALVQLKLQEHLMTGTLRRTHTAFIPVWRKLLGVPMLLVGGPPGIEKYTLFALWIVAWALFLYAASATRDAKQRFMDRLRAHRFELLSVAVVGLFLGAPLIYNGADYVYQRFLVPGVLVGLVALAGGHVGEESPQAEATPTRAPLRRPIVAEWIALTIPVATFLVIWPDFAASSLNFKAIDALLDALPNQATMVTIDLDPPDATRQYNVGPAHMRALGRRGGRLVYSFTDSTVAPVRIAPRYQWDEPAGRITQDALQLRPAYDLTRFRFLLVHSRNDYEMNVVALAVSQYARPLKAAGEWELFESTLDVAPMTAPDQPLPQPAPHTLRYLMKQVRAVLDAHGIRPQPGGP